MKSIIGLVAITILLIGSDESIAQQTRAETISQQQADKSRAVAPPRPNLAESIVSRLDDWGVITGNPRGLYPWVGSVYSGGGFAAGAGFRKPFGDDGAVNAFGGRSIHGFTRGQADVTLPTFAKNRATLTLTGRYVDAPDVKYFGTGNDTQKEEQTRFGYTPTGGGARLNFNASRHLSLGGGVAYLDIKTSEGRTGTSIEDRFSPADTPGLELDSFRYVNSSAHATFDWRRLPGYSGSGGLYRLQFDDYRERDADRYSFRSLEAEVRQLIPLMRANWVVALRGLATVTDIDDAGAVPYFLLAALGGGNTLRGYPDFRFRDRHRLVMNAELRWTPARFLDMALFYDTGKVASRQTDLDFDGLHDSYGIGMRLVGPAGYAFRFEVAHSREHAARLIFGAGRDILMVTNIKRRSGWLLSLGLVVAAAFDAGANGVKFYPDDPLGTIIDSQDASGVAHREIDLTYDTLENSFSWPGDRTPNVRAQNLNTIDEVSDSNWFTNRLGVVPVTVDQLIAGPASGAGPAPGGWIVVGAKNDGVMPGFTVRDSAGQVWFIKFDPPGQPAMATGTEAFVARLFWALGYHVPETHVATLRPDQLTIGEEARITPPSGQQRPFNDADAERLLRRAHRNADGTYRVLASKTLPGRIVGPFRFYGVRSDDPNDVIPHEHRRELRAYGTFAAWVNHVDSKSINTLDTVVEQDGRQVVRHYLLDFGSTMGSAGVYPREPFEGTEYLVEGKKTLAGIPSLGFFIKDWRTVPIYRARSVGAFPSDNANWDPEKWKPRYANAAFRSAQLEDKFWAARRLQAFTDQMLEAVIAAGQFQDPASEAMLLKFLTERRDAIVRRYLPALNPVVDVRMTDSGALTFRNAAVDAGVAAAPEEYVVKWSRFDNATGATDAIAATRAGGTSVMVPHDLPSTAGTYVRAEISALGGPAAWADPVHAYFVRQASGWKLVGLER